MTPAATSTSASRSPTHGNHAGIFECAVNIRSDEGTEVPYTQRIEDPDTGGIPAEGLASGVHLAYGTGGAHSSTDFMGPHDGDFHPIINDDLYNRIADLCHGCVRVAAYGATYSDGTGLHDIHMNPGTNMDDPHARDDRVHQDGAIAFDFDLEAGGQRQSDATWVFVEFANQHVVEAWSLSR
jgi:hypothetical protein